MNKTNNKILIKEYQLLRNEFLKVVKDGKVYIPSGNPKINTPYLCRIIDIVFGYNSEIAKHFNHVLYNLKDITPNILTALIEAEDIKEEDVIPLSPFHYHEVEFRLMLIDEIIKSLS